MKRCSFWEWIPILPWSVWPLAWQCSLGQNAVVGSMTLLLAMRGNIATRSMSGPPFALQRHRTTVWCRAINGRHRHIKREIRALYKGKAPRKAKEIIGGLEHLATCLKLHKEVRELDQIGRALFGSHWHSEESDVEHLRTFATWVVSFRRQLL